MAVDPNGKRGGGRGRTRSGTLTGNPNRRRERSRSRKPGRGQPGSGGKGRSGGHAKEEGGGGEAASQRKLPQSVTTVYLGGIPTGLRVSELKTALREREAAPLRLTWQGAQHRAFLDYSDPQAAEQALEALQGLCLYDHNLQAELAKSQRGGRRPGVSNRRPRPSTAPKSEISEARDGGDKKTEQ